MSGELHASVQAKDVERLRRAIAAGGDVNERARPLQTTPLHIAARYGVLDCLALLLDSGAAVNAQGHFGSTPLYDACDYKQEAAARMLLARGASANIHGDRGRTPLHVAIKRGLVGIVREMLDAGAADPSVKSRGGDHDTLSYVKRSSASKSERAQLTEMLAQYVSLESAVASGNPKAVEAIVKRAFATNDMGTAITMYLRAVQHHAGLGIYRLRLLTATIQMNRQDLFLKLLAVGYAPETTLTAVLHHTRFEGDQVQTTALHLAAFYGHTSFIEFLVDNCDMDPEVVDALQRRPIQLVTDTSDPAGTVRSLLTRLTQKRRFRRFTSRLLNCTTANGGSLLDDQATAVEQLLPQLESLTETLSSVRDIRVVFNLGVATLAQSQPDALKRLLTRAFTQLIDDKLVVDDREALVFKIVLRECERRGLFSELEVEHWDLQLVKVNMESAPWVKAMKHSLSQVKWRVDDIEVQSRVLRQRFDELDHAIHTARASGMFSRAIARLRSVLSLFSIVLSIAGVDGASDVIDTVVDLSDPLSVLAATYKVTVTDQLTAFVDDPQAAGALVVRDELAPAFERAGINPADLAEMLREVVLLEREQSRSSEAPSIKDVEDASREAQTQVKQQRRKSIDEPESDLEQFPFHYAVQHSGGDLEAFLNVVEFIEEDPTASTKYKEAVVVLSQRGKKTKVRVSPAVLASHLGYVKITKYFLDQQDYPSTRDHEKKFVTIQRAHTMHKRLAEPAIAA